MGVQRRLERRFSTVSGGEALELQYSSFHLLVIHFTASSLCPGVPLTLFKRVDLTRMAAGEGRDGKTSRGAEEEQSSTWGVQVHQHTAPRAPRIWTRL